MSDPFAPTPLPPRPVYQEADIAERQAAAANREIDTRLRESTETGRRKMERGLEVARRDYAERREEIRMDYDRALNSPIAQFVSSIPQMALQIYEGIKAQNAQESWNLESGRLQAQSMDAHMALWMLERDTLAKVQTGELDEEDYLEMFYGGAMDIANSMSYSDDSRLAELNGKAQLQVKGFILDQAKSFLTKFDAFKKVEQMQAQDDLIRNTAQGYLEAFEQGDIDRWDSWVSFRDDPRNNIERTHVQKGGFLHSLETVAIQNFLINRGHRQYENLMAMNANNPGWDPEAAMAAIEADLGSSNPDSDLAQVWDRFDERLTRTQENAVISTIMGRAQGEEKKWKLAQEASQHNLYQAAAAGQLNEITPVGIYTAAQQSGLNPNQARIFTNAVVKSNKDLQNSLTAEAQADADAAKERMVSLNESQLLKQLHSDEYPGSEEFMKGIRRYEGHGLIRPNRTNWWQERVDAADKRAIDAHQGAFAYVDWLEGMLNEAGAPGEGVAVFGGAIFRGEEDAPVPLLRDADGNLVPVGAIVAPLREALEDFITDGFEGEDGERRLPTKEDSVYFVQTWAHTKILGDQYDWKGKDSEKAIEVFAGSDDYQAARGYVGRDVAPVAGLGVNMAAATVRDINPDYLDDFNEASPEDKKRIAVRSMGLEKIDRSLTPQEQQSVMQRNTSKLLELQDGGYISQGVITANGSAAIQFARNGQFVVVDLISAPVAQLTEDVVKADAKLQTWLSQNVHETLGMGEDTFYTVELPGEGGVQIIPSVTTEGVVRSAGALARAWAALLPVLQDAWDQLPAARKRMGL